MYVDSNELKIQRECLCSAKKGHPAPSPPCSPPVVFVYLCFPLPSLCLPSLPTHCLSSNHTQIKITQCDPTADTTSTATSRLCLLSADDQQSGHLSDVLTASIFPLFCSRQPQCCCFLKCGVGWGSVFFRWLYLSFLFLIWERRRVRAAFPHLGLTKHTPWCPLPLPVSHTPLLPSLLPHLSLFVCTVWTIVLVNNYYSTSPLPQVGKDNSIFLCALGNLYNSILNLNETIKKHAEKQCKRDIHEDHQQYWWD